MSITYEEALATLTSMFTAPWTEDSLDTVLRHFEGHMENTVDAVLAHGDAEPSELLRRLDSSQSGATIEDMDEVLARQLATGSPQTNSQPAQPPAPPVRPAAAQKGRGTPTDLPADFLRIPGGPTNNISDDEALARMLQDKLFAEEIRNNPEFAHLARGQRGAFPGNANRQSQGETPDVIKSLQGMGQQAKLRFQDMAAKFKKKIKEKQNQNQSNGYSQVGVAERRGLLDIHDDDDEQEISFVGSGNGNDSNNPDYEMSSMDNGFAVGGKKRD